MSYPSSGLMSCYRNPKYEVANFLNEKHQANYRIYNLCAEMDYTTHEFEGTKEVVPILDHNVPTMVQVANRSIHSTLQNYSLF